MILQPTAEKFDETISDGAFKILADFLMGYSGLSITSDKAYLVQSRLSGLAKEQGCTSLNQFIQKLVGSQSLALREDVAESMATPETFFFRDTKPFDQLKEAVLPGLLEKKEATKTLKIWSTACSSGQEPYSLAMIFTELGLYQKGWRIDITASDFSTRILKRAQAGEYSQFEVQRGLPIQYLVKYFEKAGSQYRVKDDLKKRIQFKPFNLLHNLSVLGKFDIIFCRNVLFYFDVPTKKKVFESLANIIEPHGVLFLGSAETVMGVSDKFGPMAGQRGIYALK